MSISALTLVTLGFVFILGLIADYLGRRTVFPRVSILLIFGVCIGPAGFDLLPISTNNWMPVVSDIALATIGFLLGSSLKISEIKVSGKTVLWVSLAVTVLTGILVAFGLWMAGYCLPLALMFGGIAPATDPAATVDVIYESKIKKGEFSGIVLKITAIDDAWGLIAFSFMFAAAQMISGNGNGEHMIVAGAVEIAVSLAIGVALGVPMSFLTGRLQPGEPTLAEALGMVFICSGISLMLDASYLLSSMAMGAVVANLAKHHERPFHEIEGIEWPIIIIFFIFAGVSIRLEDIAGSAMLIALYICLRVAGRFAGAVLGAKASARSPRYGVLMGLALMPQAGVALGMALTVAHRFEEFRSIVSVIVATTVFFEIVGPVCTRLALKKAAVIEQGE